ncbi:hypothetical protein N7533_002824 [Penicillium manginii]|uniref:uncharacterized protein n=1 Tax=Penicillium manginii TaxID=203109 RepID=UPI00254820EA|nr:uncharacterized protein N7533_002824 [Penicillium manginii]KAJ5764143.1 hypothetical protein N7533_002824 [Penicillium manginii]
MGLFKTGLVLAGGYGLVKAVSKAANDHEDKKQKRQNQNMPPYQGQNDTKMSHMYQAQPNNQYPQWGTSPDQQSYNGNHMQQGSSRSVQDSPMYQPKSMNNCPPPYSESYDIKGKGDHKSGSAREYYYSQ